MPVRNETRLQFEVGRRFGPGSKSPPAAERFGPWATRSVGLRTGWLAAIVAIASAGACSSAPKDLEPTDAAAAFEGDPQSGQFVADPDARMTHAAWDAFLQRVVAQPGARITADGPLLLSVGVGPPSRPAFYLFTTERHPAHPAFLRMAPGDVDETETTVEAGFAGSQEEYEKFVRAFLAHMASSQ